jgi:TetR/AcrR family transcriptional repressor of uid operon
MCRKRTAGSTVTDVATTVPLITTDDLILDAAEDCFVTVGVRGTTMDAIAAAAGVSRITVYRRIGNRDQIVLAVLLRIVDRYLARLLPRLLAQRSLDDALLLLIRNTVRAARRDDLSLLFASEERGATGAPIAGAMPPLAERFGGTIEQLARELPGGLAPDIDGIDAGEWTLRVIISLATTEPAKPRSEADTDRLVRRLVLPGIVDTGRVAPTDDMN